MDQLIFASISRTHYWYEVGMLKVTAYSNVKRINRGYVTHYTIKLRLEIRIIVT